MMVGVQCNGCSSYKKRVLSILFQGWSKGKCTRISPIDGKKGVCWMRPREGEY